MSTETERAVDRFASARTAIRDVIEQQKIRQHDLALALGMTEKHISCVLTGKTDSPQTLAEIGAQLGLAFQLLPAASPESSEPPPGVYRDGVSRIASERQRQIDVERWSPAHDAQHREGDLARAAACYAMPAGFLPLRAWNATASGGSVPDRGDRIVRYPSAWPWHPSWWKPTGDLMRDLEKAGALIAAEIDRLLVAGSRQTERGNDRV